MQTPSSSAKKADAASRTLHRRHDRPVDAVLVWIGLVALYCALQYITGNPVGTDDLHGLILGGVIVYCAAAGMDRIARKLAD
jgi:hypothetical protein